MKVNDAWHFTVTSRKRLEQEFVYETTSKNRYRNYLKINLNPKKRK